MINLKQLSVIVCGSFYGAVGSIALASEVEIPNTFTAGSAAVAAEVNANFTAVKTAVDDNHATIETLQTQVQTLQTENQTLQESISALETAVEDLQSAQDSTVASVVWPRLLNSNYVDFDLDDSKGVFTLQFNVAMDTNSVKIGNNLTVSGSGGSGTGTIEWLHGNTTLKFTMTEDFTTVSPCFSGGVNLTVLGDGESPVTDAQGKRLDGDKNGLPGGDFVINFDIVC